MDGENIRINFLSCFLGFALFAMPVFAEDVPQNADNGESVAVDKSEPVAEPVDDSATTEDTATEESATTGTPDEPTGEAEETALTKPEHVYKIAAFPEDKTIHAELKTSLGTVSCELFAGTHPLTVINFMALAKGTPAWSDKAGTYHSEPYYQNLKFVGKSKNAYVMSGLREEGTNFVLHDERCTSHGPVAGAIAMVQPHPGMASTQFILLARDMPIFKGMYVVFGQCGPIDMIQKLTKSEAVLESIAIDE